VDERKRLSEEELPHINFKKLIGVVLVGVLAIFLAATSGYLLETNRAGFYQVKQAAITGDLSVRINPGMYAQMFGRITTYKLSNIYYFSNEEGTEGDVSSQGKPVRVRFNDGGRAFVDGNVRYDLPPNSDGMVALHKKFRSYSNFQYQGIKQLVEEAIFLTAALMSADEAYTTKRALFSEWAWDQVSNGIFLTEERIEETTDPITGETKIRNFVEIKRDKNGEPLRKPNVLRDYGVNISQFVVKEIDYEEGVDKQIAVKREALMKTIAAEAEAVQAQQDRLTAEERGKKNVAVARYAALEVKEKATVDAERKVEVARQDKLAAKEYKAAQILRASADAEYARKLIEADGALKVKLEALVEIQKFWATAIQNSGQRWVPDIVIGGDGAASGSGAQDLIRLLTAQSAKALGADLTVKEGRTIGRQSSNALPRLESPTTNEQTEPEKRVAVAVPTQSGGVQCDNCGSYNSFSQVNSNKVGTYWQCSSCKGVTTENPLG
jgi:hypothetical protein